MKKNKLVNGGIVLAVMALFFLASVIAPNIKMLTGVESAFYACVEEISDEVPDDPSQPSGNTSGDICIDYNYSTSTTDPNGLNVSYGWDWDGDLIVDEWTDWYESNETCTIAHNWSDPDDYNISVKAKNTLEFKSNWSAPLNVTMVNHPPYIPSKPEPGNGSPYVQVNTTLCWIGDDPDSCDTVTYDVYFGVTNPPNKKSSNQTGTCYDPGTLEYYRQYYWWIRAWDNHGAFTDGPIWQFTTGSPPCPPTPVIDGPTCGKVGIKYEYTFYIEDNGCYDVSIYVDWGDGSTNWTVLIEPGTEIKLNHTWHEKGSYIITAKAKDIWGCESGWGCLEVTMPKNKPFNFNFNLLSWLFERFPLLNQIASLLMEKWI